MAWNQPGSGGTNNQDPWGNKKSQSPPDLDKLLGQFINKLRTLFFRRGLRGGNAWPPSSGHHVGFGMGIIGVVLLLVWFLAGLFIVNPAEEAVVLRFGKFSDVLQPGLHWMARFIDTKYLIDVQKIYSFSLQGDFLTKSSEQSDLPHQVNPADLTSLDAEMSSDTSDKSKNLVSVELNVQYHVADPRAYLFSVVNPDETIKQVATGALSDVIGQMKLDEVLTTGREYLSSGVLNRVKQILLGYNTGLEVSEVTLRKVAAPDQVKVAFNDVNRADQDKATYIQQAQAYASKVVPLAQGVAARIMANANGYQQQVVLNAQAHVAKYQAMLVAYQAAPEITRERLYLEAMQTVLQNSSKVLIDVNSANNILYLPIDKFAAFGKSSQMPRDITSYNAAASSTAVTANESANILSQLSGTEVKSNGTE